MNSIWNFNESRWISAFTMLLVSENPSLIVIKIIMAIAVLLFILKFTFLIKQQWWHLGTISTAVMNYAKYIFLTIGNKICELFLLKSKTSFLVGGSFLLVVSFLLIKNNMTISHVFVLSTIVVLYFLALIYFIIQLKTEKTPQKDAENERKTQGKTSYSNEKHEDLALNPTYHFESEHRKFSSDSFSDPIHNFNTDKKRSIPPRSKIKKEHDKKFYESREWRELRFQILNSHGRRCNLCHSTEGTFHVDHIKPRSKYPHLELTPSNLQVLCEDCNLGKSDFE